MSGMKAQVWRFGLVGAMGLAIDGGITLLLTGGGFGPYLARAIAFPVAVLATWALHRQWTFRQMRGGNAITQLWRYVGVQLVGIMANYGVYAVVIASLGRAQSGVAFGVVCGSAVGAILNFFGARDFAFRSKDQPRENR